MSFLGWLKSNSSDEIEGLIETHLDGLYSLALRYMRDRALAEDLVQDTVVRILHFRDRFTPGTNFKAWAYTILTHTFIHRYRRQKRERVLLDGQSRVDVDQQLHSEQSREFASRPENSYLQNMLSDDVVKALDSIPEEYRTVVILCDVEGLTYKEISDIISSPVGTVMSRLYRGRRMLEVKLYDLACERGIVRGKSQDSQQVASNDKVLDINVFRRRKSG
ncbi:MAG: sigma-70 family RNA polymerase sigma factor [Deltaproteobacteria bacterium]|nr:sigma-70 family RNA polymerase sigma factor [Deltaproteobacteria bacterium]